MWVVEIPFKNRKPKFFMCLTKRKNCIIIFEILIRNSWINEELNYYERRRRRREHPKIL